MLKDRIRELRKSLDMTQVEFSTKLGVGQSNTADWERGRSCPSIEALTNLANVYNINLNWLLTGKGNMHCPKIDEEAQKTDLKQKVFNFIRNELSVMEPNDSIIPPGADDFWYLPIAGEIAAGIPLEFNPDIEPIHHVPILKKQLENPDDCDVLRVNGKSMEPKIEHSDLVVIKRTNDWMGCNYKVVAARTDDGITLKKLKIDHEKGTAFLIPFNPDFDIIPVDEDTEICGYLILLVRQC
jgi:SOS-response transcriptional repressor LexA